MLVHTLLETSATQYPDKVAVIHDDNRVTYNQLNANANSMSAHLQAAGVAQGDRVVLLIENGIDYITAYYGALKAGAVAAP